jgi:hypothetical protein
MLASAANWKEGEPSLDSAVSWKDGEPSLDSAVSWKEGKPSLDSAANWKEGEPSLDSAVSWKEAYRSETFWMKSLLSSVDKWEEIDYRMSLEEDYETESWEMIYKCEQEFESLCETERDIYDRRESFTWRQMYNASDSSGSDFSDSDFRGSDDDDYRYNSDYEGGYEYEDYGEEYMSHYFYQ